MLTLSLIILGISFIGCLDTSRNELESEHAQFPLKKEIGNYIVDIEYTKYFKNYLLTKYSVTAKDGSDIEKNSLFVSTGRILDDTEYSGGPQYVLDSIGNKRNEFITTYYIAAKSKEDNSIKVEYSFNGKGLEGEELRPNPIPLSTDGYKYIHKKFYLDGIDYTVESLGNFEFGSLLHFYIEDAEREDTGDITNKYKLKLKSGDYINMYDLKGVLGYNKKLVKKVSELGDFNKDSKYIQFYGGYLLYDTKDVDVNNMQIYLVNNETQEETLLYST